MLNKILHIFRIALLAIAVFSAVAALLMQTRPFKNWLANFIGSTVSKNLNAELSIGRIEGNFFTHIALHNTTLTTQGDTLAFVPRLSLAYKPGDVLHKKISIASLTIESPSFFVQQFADSSWNFQLAPEQQTSPPPHQQNNSPFSWTLDLEHFELLNLHADIAALDSMIPEQISNLNIKVAALVAPDEKWLDLQHLSFLTAAPDFELVSLSFQLEQNADEVNLNHFRLQTAQNKVDAQAGVDFQTRQNGYVQTNTAPIHFDEFQFVLPDINIKGAPALQLQSELVNDQLDAVIGITSDKSQVDIKMTLQHFSALLSDSAGIEPRYTLDAVLKNITLSDWTSNSHNTVHLNSTISISGRGITAQTADASARIQLANSRIDEYAIQNMDIKAEYQKGSAQAKINMQTDMGRLAAHASVTDILKKQHFNATITCREIDLHPLLNDSSLTSNLNFDIAVSGTSFSLSHSQADLHVWLRPSSFYQIDIDTAFIDAGIKNKALTLNTLHVSTPDLKMAARGRLDAEADFVVEIHALNLNALKDFIPADSLGGSLRLIADVQGHLDSLLIESRIDIDSVHYNTITVDSVRIDMTARKLAENLTAAAHARISTVAVGAFNLNDIELNAELTPDLIDLKTNVRQSDDQHAQVHLQYLLNELPIIFIKQFDVDVAGRQWRGGSDQTSIMLGDGEYIVTDFLIQRQDVDTTTAQVYIDGAIRLNGEENFIIKVQNYNPEPLTAFIQNKSEIDGAINLDIHLTGSAERPKLAISTRLENLRYDDIRIKAVHGYLQYDNEQIHTQLSIIPEADSLLLQATIPAHFSLAEQTFSIVDDQPFHANITSGGLPIASIFPPSLGLDKLSGTLKLNVQAGNTLANIKPSGSIFITNGAFLHQEFGAGFDHFDVELGIKQDSLILRQFSGRNGKGTISINGFAALDSSIFSGVLKAISLTLKADRFYLSRKPEHEMQINSNIALAGPIDSLRFDGNLEILRSSFYLPALRKNNGKTTTRRQPLLIKAMAKTAADSTKTDTTVIINEQAEAPQILKNLRGKLNVNIPRNTWFKSDNMRVELNGNVDILKNSDYFEFFGPVRILRGQYDFLGRRFRLTDGTASFQGGQSINPALNVTAEYTFRDSRREKHAINLNVTGNAQNPDIKFLMDDQHITEGEAVSYILFNRSPDEMSSQQTGSQNGSAYRTSDLVYGLMSAELSKRFGQQLGVDYLEIKGKDNLNEATFIVGKYITPDLFMSYEHYIGTLEEDQAPQVVTVEYELTKYLFLQLISGDTKSTGADLVIKFDHE